MVLGGSRCFPLTCEMVMMVGAPSRKYHNHSNTRVLLTYDSMSKFVMDI